MRRPRPCGAGGCVRVLPRRGRQAEGARREDGEGQGRVLHGAPRALREGGGTYRWHAGAPDDESFARAFAELVGRIDARLEKLDSSRSHSSRSPRRRKASPRTSKASPRAVPGHARKSRTSTSSQAYGDALVELGAAHEHLVVLDADLASDCRVRDVRADVSRNASSSAGSPSRTWSRRRPESPGTACSRSSTRSRPSSPPARTSRSTTRRARRRRSSTRSTTRASSQRARASRTSPCAMSRSSPRCPNVTIVQPANAEETAELAALGGRGRGGERRDPARDRAVAASDRAPRRRSARTRVAARCSARERRRALRLRARDAARGAARVRVARADGVGMAVVNMPWLNRLDAGWLAEVVGLEAGLRARGPRAGRRARRRRPARAGRTLV